MDRKPLADWNLPTKISFHHQDESTDLVALVYEDGIRGKHNPLPLPRRFSQNRRLLGCLPVHPSLEVDHGVLVDVVVAVQRGKDKRPPCHK